VGSTILVTGAAGFIGSHLCQRLTARGDEVVGLDNFDPFYPRAVKESNLAPLRDSRGVSFSFVEGDIRDEEALGRLFSEHRFDAVVHLAARAGVRPSIADPVGYEEVNVRGTVAMLEASARAKVGRFVFASSSSVYGNNRKVPFAEDDPVDHPISPYAATKKACELICHTYAHLHGMGMSCLRFFTVYGPRQRPDLAIHKFVRKIESGEAIQMYGDGSMRRDFTYIDDIVSGVVASIDRCGGYEVYNLGNSSPVRLDELIERIERALGKRATIERMPMQPGDVDATYADVTKARRDLGFAPVTPVDEGLARFVEWFRAEGQRLQPGGSDV
jgi:UDP-glucuronate 4-epimerase